jgi:rhamnogalacturonyl hydrolase YesR
MIHIDTRVLAFVVWGLGTVLAYAYVMDGRYRTFLTRRDRRSVREFSASVALFLTALASSIAIGLSLWNEDGEAARQFFSALALGAFFAAGVVMATDRASRQ